MSVSINLSGVEPYNGKPTTVKIDVEAGVGGNQLNTTDASLEQSPGTWHKEQLYPGTKTISLVDHVTKNSEENLLSPESASLDGGIGDWDIGYGLISYTSEGPAKNLLSYNSAVLEGLGSSIGGWTVLGSSDPRTGSKTAFIPGGLASINGAQKNLLSTDTASIEHSLGGWTADTNCSSLTREVSSLTIAPLIGEHVGKFTSNASGACNIRSGTVSADALTGYSAIAYVRKLSGTFTQARIGIRWSTGATTWSSYSTVSTGAWTKLSIDCVSPSSTTSARLFVEYTATAAGNALLFDKTYLSLRDTDQVGEWYYPTSAVGSFTAVGQNHGVLVNSDLNTAGVGTNRVFSEVVGGTLAVGTTRYASAYLSTKDATYITSARVGINWQGTNTIDWGTAITPSASSWTQATTVGTAVAGNSGFRVVIEFTIASSAGAQAEGYFDKVSAGVGSTPYWSVPGITTTVGGITDVFNPSVGDGYGLVSYNGHINDYVYVDVYESGTKDCAEGEHISVSALLSARDSAAVGGRIGIEWLGSPAYTYSFPSEYQSLTVGTWKESLLYGALAPSGATGWRVVITFKFLGDSTGGLFDRISTNKTETPEWSYPALEDSPPAGAIGSGYGVATTTNAGSGTIRVSSSLVGSATPGTLKSAVASLARGDSNVSTGRVGILWEGTGGVIDWGATETLTDVGTWYEAKIEGAEAPAGATGWYVLIEFDTTGTTTAAYFDKIAAVSGDTVDYNQGLPKVLIITRSTTGYPGERILYDNEFIGTTTYFDRAVPLDCLVTYNVSYGTAPSEVASASITLDGVPSDSQVCYPCLVSDPKNTDYIQAATLQIYRPFEYQERMSINDVIGSAYPIALSGKRSAARGSITMITHTQQQADRMRTLFSTGRSLMFRVMSEARPEKPAIAIAVSKVAEEPVILPHISRPERKWNIDFVEIALPVIEQLFITENTWGEVDPPSGIAGSYDTWGDLVANVQEAPTWYYVVSNPAVIN